MAFGNKRLNNIEKIIRSGKWVDPRKWPKQKILISQHQHFFNGFVQHERMALLKTVNFRGDFKIFPVWINKNFSFPNASQIATLEEAGIVFIKDN